MRTVFRVALLSIVPGAIASVLACDSTSSMRPRQAGLARAPAISPAYNAAGQFTNPYASLGEWHNALVDSAWRAANEASRRGATSSVVESQAIQGEANLVRSHFVDNGTDFSGFFSRGKYAVAKRAEAMRLYADPTILGELDSARKAGYITPAESIYVRRLLAITDGARNLAELTISLSHFEEKAYKDLGPKRSMLVLGPSAVFKASANMWVGQAAMQKRAGRTLPPSASEEPCDVLVPTGAAAIAPSTSSTVCGGGGGGDTGGDFYPSSDGNYLVNDYADTIYVVPDPNGGQSWTSRFLSGVFKADGAGALSGLLWSFNGCAEVTAGDCAIMSTVVGAAGGTLSYSLYFSPPTGEGGEGGLPGSGGCPSNTYPGYYQGSPACIEYPI